MTSDKIFEDVILKNALITSDFHDCSEESLWQIKELGEKSSCNVHINAGDFPDKFIGHKAFENFQNYVYLVDGFNKSTNPADYAHTLTSNWNLLNEENCFLHFHYYLESSIVPSGTRNHSIYIVHNPGVANFLRTKTTDLNNSTDCYFHQLPEIVKKIIANLINKYGLPNTEEFTWINTIIFGHVHYKFEFNTKGVRLINSGEWGDNKECFLILMPGPWTTISGSLTENFNRVFTPVDFLSRIKNSIVLD